MAKQYATINKIDTYNEREISYEESWNKENFFVRYNRKRKAKNKKEVTIVEMFFQLILGILEIF